MKTLWHDDGAVGLEAVYPYQNSRLAPGAVFDDLTRLAACVGQTPVALLCFSDAKRWWLKSQVGIAPGSTDSYVALCTETLGHMKSWDSPLLIVRDALADQRLATHELVTASQQVRFCAAVPLVIPQGAILGILAVSDRIPRTLTLPQQEALLALSRQATSLLTYHVDASSVLGKDSTHPEEIASKVQQEEEVKQRLQQKLADIKLALNCSSLMAITDHKGKIKYVNDKFCEISQYSQEELLGEDHRLVNSGYHSSDFFKRMWATLTSGKVWSDEIRNRAKDGSFYWVETTIVPILNDRGKPYEYVSICQDITERKQVEVREQEMQGEQGENRASITNCKENDSLPASSVPSVPPAIIQVAHFFTLAPDLLCVVGLDGYFKRVNPACEKTLAYTADELLSRPFLNFVHPDDKAATLAALEELTTNASVINVENRYRCGDGSYKWLAWNYFGVVGEGVVYAIARDITQSKQTEIDSDRAKEERRQRWEALVFWLARQIRSSSDLDTILDTAVAEIRNLMQVDCCHFLWCWSQPNQPSLSVTHEARNPDLPSLLGEDPLPQFAPLEQSIRNLQRLRIDNLAEALDLAPETRSPLADWGLTAGLLLPLLTQTGQLGGIFCSHYNRPRRWDEEEVERLQAVVNQIAIAIEHAELFANTRAAALAAQTQARQLELTLHELQQTESLLIQSEKMSSLGQMVAGIAHEINNPVSFITGNLLHATNYVQDLLGLIKRYQQHYSNPEPGLQKYIEEIDLEFLLEDLPKVLSSMQIGADRIHEIVLSLRNFSRADEAEMKPVNIHEGIDHTLLILHNRLKPSGNNPGITIVKEYDDLPAVQCYAGQLNQVFMNIISNAIDALESGRAGASKAEITSEAGGKVQQEENCSSTSLAFPAPQNTPSPTIWIGTELLQSDRVLIRIRDNGPGMAQCVLKHLFDPFFTTKPLGKGTGLGLSISHQIVVEKHGGVLQCFSEPGQGAEFWIQIPIAPQLPQSQA